MSRKQTPQMLTAKQFAERMKINYRTALNWLEGQLVPGAERKESLIGSHWEIPVDALRMERPKPGPKPGAKTNDTPKKGGKK
jgi:hypothetical protein